MRLVYADSKRNFRKVFYLSIIRSKSNLKFFICWVEPCDQTLRQLLSFLNYTLCFLYYIYFLSPSAQSSLLYSTWHSELKSGKKNWNFVQDNVLLSANAKINVFEIFFSSQAVLKWSAERKIVCQNIFPPTFSPIVAWMFWTLCPCSAYYNVADLISNSSLHREEMTSFVLLHKKIWKNIFFNVD